MSESKPSAKSEATSKGLGARAKRVQEKAKREGVLLFLRIVVWQPVSLLAFTRSGPIAVVLDGSHIIKYFIGYISIIGTTTPPRASRFNPSFFPSLQFPYLPFSLQRSLNLSSPPLLPLSQRAAPRNLLLIRIIRHLPHNIEYYVDYHH